MGFQCIQHRRTAWAVHMQLHGLCLVLNICRETCLKKPGGLHLYGKLVVISFGPSWRPMVCSVALIGLPSCIALVSVSLRRWWMWGLTIGFPRSPLDSTATKIWVCKAMLIMSSMLVQLVLGLL